MRRRLVNSSSIVSIGYDSKRRELEIEFRESGDVYRYFDVPIEESCVSGRGVEGKLSKSGPSRRALTLMS
jgi:hypothetical protein